MKEKKLAFTFAEVLITLGIVGIIASIILASLKQHQPDRHKLLFKKAYNNIERVVTEIINDDYLYPEGTKADGSAFLGLDMINNEVKINDDSTSYVGNKKFCNLFALKLNTISSDDINCPGTPGGNGSFGTPSFITNEGIAYYIPSTNFTGDTTITIDVNGDKEPNCKYNAASCPAPDKYEIIVSPDGGIHVDGDLEKSYLRSNTVVKD